MQNLVMSMVSGIAPGARSRAGQQSLVLEVLCLLLDIIAPKLRPVSALQPPLAVVTGVLLGIMCPLCKPRCEGWDTSPALQRPG